MTSNVFVIRSDEVASPETAITSDFIAERLGVLLAVLRPDFDGLAAVVKAWPALPDAIRRAILAMVEASRGSEQKGVAR